jgi:glycosyltransferase EpsF
MPAPLLARNPTMTVRDPIKNISSKVWHVVGPMNQGGAEVMVMELLRHKSPDTQMDFLVHHRDGYKAGSAAFDSEILTRGAQLLTIKTPVQSGLFGYFRAFRQRIRQQGRPDVIHIHLNARSGLVVLAARLNGIKRIIVHSHAALTFRGSLGYRIFAQAELQLSKLIFAALATDFWGCSHEAIDSLFRRWPSRGQPRVVINNAIDVDSYEAITPAIVAAIRPVLAGHRPGLLIGTVGRIVRHKNAGFLIDVLDALRRRNVLATAVIVGREQDAAYCSELRAAADAAGLNDALRFVGERDDIPAVMAALDVFVSPALREGFGLVGAEAQAAGTPCVLSTGFPTPIDMGLGLVQFLDGFDADIWAEAILSACNISRPTFEMIAHSFKQKGFSARENTARIERAWRNPGTLPTAGEAA